MVLRVTIAVVRTTSAWMQKRPCSCFFSKSYEVKPSSTVNGYISCNTIVHPIIDSGPNEKVIIKCNRSLAVNQIGSSLNITSSKDPYDETSQCELHVPMKSNLNITSSGSIKLSNSLQSEGVRLFSENGDVTIGNLKCTHLSVGTNDHDIITEGTIEAECVELLCRRKGKIRAQNIKCLGIKMDTQEGDIHMNACYSRNGLFMTRSGNLYLKNVHNRCRIDTFKKGTINLMGLEGALELAMQKGIADIQIQKIFDDSDILLREEGDITVRIPTELLDYVNILVWSKGCYVDDEIPHKEDELKDLTTIGSNIKPEHTLRIRCMKGTCNVRIASWIDMIEKGFIASNQQPG